MTGSDGLRDVFPAYADDPKALRRLSARWHMIVAPVAQDLRDARILDIGAHDGRWAYAFAHAGAAAVTAVEPRPDHAARFTSLPADTARDNITFVPRDALGFLDAAVAAKDRYDIVAILGFLYHTIEHYRLFALISQLRPRLIIVDSEFVDTKNGVIQMTAERSDNPLNAYSATHKQQRVLVGTPSVGALERIAADIGYRVIWPDLSEQITQAAAKDYQRSGRKRRMICHLVPVSP